MKKSATYKPTLLVLTAAAALFSASMTAASPPEQQRQIIYAKTLPIWGEDRSTLEYLDISPPQWQSRSKRYIRRFGLHRGYTPPAGLLPNGWEVEPLSSNGRATWFTSGVMRFTLRHARSGKTATWLINEPRLPLLGTAHTGVSAAHILNDRYIAFSVSDGSFVFFDRTVGKFVPRAVKASSRLVEEACRDVPVNFVVTCVGDMVSLWLSPAGDVLVSAGDDIFRYAPLPKNDNAPLATRP
jgi:hypothetical protein